MRHKASPSGFLSSDCSNQQGPPARQSPGLRDSWAAVSLQLDHRTLLSFIPAHSQLRQNLTAPYFLSPFAHASPASGPFHLLFSLLEMPFLS